MRKIMLTLMGLLALTFMSCSDDDKNDGIKNYWTISCENKTLYDNDTEGVKLTVTLAYSADKDIVLTPVMEGNDDSVFEFSSQTVTIKKGEKTAEFALRACGDKIMQQAGNIVVSFLKSEQLNSESNKPATVHAEPAVVVELTEQQRELIETWRKDYGIDIRMYLGALSAKAVITFNDDDKDLYNDGKTSITYNSVCPVTVSEKASADKIVLRMNDNALGLRDFLYSMFKKQSVADSEYWLCNSHNTDLLKAIGYNADKETFAVSLDIEIDPKTKEVKFVTGIPDSYGDETVNIPFEYNYSAWNRQKEMADNGSMFIMNNGDAAAEEIKMSEAIEMGITLNPVSFLLNSAMDYDAWENAASLYVAPTALCGDKSISFTFPWDFMYASGYEKIEVTLTNE